MRNKLMVLGPTEIEKDILAAGAFPMDYMRTPEYSKRLQKIFANLQYVFATQSPVLIYACSGTGIMEAAVVNSCKEQDTVLVVNGGSFGERWADICKNYGIKVQEIKVPFGQSVNPHDIKKELDSHPEICAVFTTLDETSSGALTDMKSIGEIVCNYPQVLLVCDAVSGLIVEPLEMDKWHVDVVVSSSQKALALPPGLAFMAVSDKAQNRLKEKHLPSYYFAAEAYLRDWYRGQTPFTPAVSLLAQLEQRLTNIKNTGIENIRKKYAENTKYLRDGLKKLGLNTFAQNPANAVTGVQIENALEIVKVMREKYHIEIAPSGGDRGKNFLRIGLLGNIDKKDIDEFLSAFNQTIDELKRRP